MLAGLACTGLLVGWCVMWWFILTPSRAPVRLRNRFTFAFGAAIWVVAAVVMFAAGVVAEPLAAFTLIAIAALSCWAPCFGAVVTMMSLVRLTRRLIVINPMLAVHIPWRSVREVRWREGFEIVADGLAEPLAAAAFQVPCWVR